MTSKQRLENVSPYNLAFKNLGAYVALQNPNYIFAKHCIAIIKALMLVEQGKINRLIINMPPRHGKTNLISEFFPAWYLGRNPSNQIIFATYSFERSGDVGRKVRNQLTDPMHSMIFPGITVSKDNAGMNRVSTTQGGNFFSVGVGGAIVGRGAHCLPSGSKLITSNGEKDISDIYTELSLGHNINVLSCNHEVNKVEFKEVIAGQISYSNDIYEIETVSGKKIKATGNHEFYTTNGYTKVIHLCAGQAIGISPKYALHGLWKTSTERESSSDLSNMLFQDSQIRGVSELQFLWKRIHSIKRRLFKIYSSWSRRSLLFERLFGKTSCIQTSQKMRDLRESVSQKNNAILLKGMQTDKIQNQKNPMWFLLKRIQAFVASNKILFNGLQECWPFQRNDWKWKFAFQGWNKLCHVVPNDETHHNGTRQFWMCLLQECEEVCSPSYKYESSKQRCFKFNSSLSVLSYNSSQIEYDTISVVRKVCGNSIPVYDLQVKDNHNFFANEILSHNCFIIDDPVKSREESESELQREKLIDWFRSVAYTRLMPGNAIIVVMTRWHHQDLAGFMVDDLKHENWHVISLPAIAEEDNDAIGRMSGEALWPERYPLDTLYKIRETIGTREWTSQYQQSPVPSSGGMVHLDWFKRYKHNETLMRLEQCKHDHKIPLPYEINRIVCSWDTAFKESQLNDPSACTVWGITKSNTEFYLLETFTDRLGFPALKKKVVDMYEKYRAISGKQVAVIVEDRGSGQSLIQEMRKETGMPIIAFPPENSKQIRLDSVAPLIEAGRVFLPERTPWLVQYETEISRFPLWKHDDLVDSTSQFLQWAGKPRFIRSKLKFWK